VCLSERKHSRLMQYQTLKFTPNALDSFRHFTRSEIKAKPVFKRRENRKSPDFSGLFHAYLVQDSKRDSAINQVPITTKPKVHFNYCIHFQVLHQSKRDSAINQVPITTNPSWLNYCTLLKLLVVTITLKKFRPISLNYKVRLRSSIRSK
jgi:hypothetical protein